MNLNTKISRMSKARKVDGHVGIEIECEVRNEMTRNWDSKFWSLHRDGSLRGVGYEFVLARPIHIKDVDPALKEWRSLCDAYDIRFVDSKRTSVHVHCNVQDYTILQVLNVVCAYWLCEPLLLNICGEERKGNLFCLGLDCADTVHTQLIQNLKKHQFFQGFAKDAYRYASLNLEALYKFGSLEFRTMRGTQDTKLISSWARELHYLVSNAAKAKSPHDFLELINAGKHKKFLRRHFTESFVAELIKATGHSWRDIINSRAMYVMDILHARDEWDPVKDELAEKKIQEERKKNQKAMKWPYEHHDGNVYDVATFWPLDGAHGFPRFQGREVGSVIFEQYNDRRRAAPYIAPYYWSGLDWIPIEMDNPRTHQVHDGWLQDTTYMDIDHRLIEQHIERHLIDEEPRPDRVEFRLRVPRAVRVELNRAEIPPEIVGLRPDPQPDPQAPQLIVDDVVEVARHGNDVDWWANAFRDDVLNQALRRNLQQEPERPNNDEPQV